MLMRCSRRAMQALGGATTKATEREIFTNLVSVSDEEAYRTASSDGDWRFEGKMTVGAEAVDARSENVP
jgi:hypothetical protein